MNETIYSKLEENLERLKLKQMHLHLNEASKQSVVGDTSFVEILYNLTEHELQLRAQNAVNAMVRVGNFPHQKGDDCFRQPRVYQNFRKYHFHRDKRSRKDTFSDCDRTLLC